MEGLALVCDEGGGVVDLEAEGGGFGEEAGGGEGGVAGGDEGGAQGEACGGVLVHQGFQRGGQAGDGGGALQVEGAGEGAVGGGLVGGGEGGEVGFEIFDDMSLSPSPTPRAERGTLVVSARLVVTGFQGRGDAVEVAVDFAVEGKLLIRFSGSVFASPNSSEHEPAQ